LRAMRVEGAGKTKSKERKGKGRKKKAKKKSTEQKKNLKEKGGKKRIWGKKAKPLTIERPESGDQKGEEKP